MKKVVRIAPLVVCVLVISSNVASFGEDNKNSQSNRQNSSEQFVSSGIRSHGEPTRDWTPSGAPSVMDVLAGSPSVKNDDANGEDAWLLQNFQNKAAAKALAVGANANNPIACRSNPCFTMGGLNKTITFVPVWVGNWNSQALTQWNDTFSALVNSYGSAKPTNHVLNTNVGYFRANETPSLKWLSHTTTTPLIVGTKNTCGIAARGINTGPLFCVTDANVGTYIGTYMAAATPKVTDGSTPVYVYIGARDTRLSSGFGNAYCGWHSYGTVGGSTQPFIAIQDYDHTKISGCGTQTVSPNTNGIVSLDAMASVLAHEIDETLTDPNVSTGWLDNQRTPMENADKCAWTFGTTTPGSNPGSRQNFSTTYNSQAFKYLIQQNWLANNKVTASGAATGTACSVTGN